MPISRTQTTRKILSKHCLFLLPYVHNYPPFAFVPLSLALLQLVFYQLKKCVHACLSLCLQRKESILYILNCVLSLSTSIVEDIIKLGHIIVFRFLLKGSLLGSEFCLPQILAKMFLEKVACHLS